jgi:hypothetical protein
LHKINTLLTQMYSQNTENTSRRPYFITQKQRKQKSESTLISIGRYTPIPNAQSFNETPVSWKQRGRILFISTGLKMTRKAMQVFSQIAGAPTSTTTT